MYATRADLESRYGAEELVDLTDRDNTGSADQAVIDQALLDATGEINSYIATRYTIPLEAPFPEQIIRTCCDITRYRLMGSNPLDEAKERYTQAVSYLKSISAGRAVLPINEEKQPVVIVTNRSKDERIFTAETLKDY